jgi:hypothetical protein
MTPIRVALAFIVAPAIPAAALSIPELLFGATLKSTFPIFILVSIVTYSHAILLGIPTVFILTRLHRLTLIRVLGTAFLIGALPVTAWTIYNEITMPLGSSYTYNWVPHRIDSQLTAAGWKSTIDGIVMCGVIGLVAGIAWWWISGASANSPLKPTHETRG